MSKKCDWCGSEFTPAKNHPNQRFCSRICNDTWYLNNRPKKYTFVCKNCGKEYKTTHRDRDQYCSRECAFDDYQSWHFGDYNKEKPLKNKCIVCNKEFDGRGNLCSDECRKIRNRHLSQEYSKQKKELITYVCKECQTKFIPEYGDKRKMFCSEYCRRKYTKRIAKAYRRARKKNREYESIDPIIVFERDKWHCYICGVSTPKELRGTYRDNAPELDHVIPLSRGGSHTYKNVRCSCRLCNQLKGGDMPMQSPPLSKARPCGWSYACDREIGK